MDKIILIGGGGHAHACIDVIEQARKFDIAGIVEHNENTSDHAYGYPIIGTDDDLVSLKLKFKYAFISIGFIKTSSHRKNIYNKLIQLGYHLPVIISPNAYVARDVAIGGGTIIMHNALINAGTKIGLNCIINTKSLIEHDSVIGDNCHISTSSVINGNVNVGKDVFIGSNATVIQGSKIPNGSFLKACQLYKG